jgi:hypothetical protein
MLQKILGYGTGCESRSRVHVTIQPLSQPSPGCASFAVRRAEVNEPYSGDDVVAARICE